MLSLGAQSSEVIEKEAENEVVEKAWKLSRSDDGGLQHYLAAGHAKSRGPTRARIVLGKHTIMT